MNSVRTDARFFRKTDLFFARHQRLCWLMAAALAVAGGMLILKLLPAPSHVYGFIALALLLSGGYYYASRAAERVMEVCLQKADTPESAREMLSVFLPVEKALPEMKKKEIAYAVTVKKGLLLLRAGKREESLSLLKGFTRCWDEQQKEYLRHLIELIETRPDFWGFARKEEN